MFSVVLSLYNFYLFMFYGQRVTKGFFSFQTFYRLSLSFSVKISYVFNCLCVKVKIVSIKIPFQRIIFFLIGEMNRTANVLKLESNYKIKTKIITAQI